MSPKFNEGDSLPLDQISFKILEDGKAKDLTGADLFTNKKVALFAVPGAFTPSCSEEHLPGFVGKADELKAKGIDAIYCVSSNDCFVTKAWAKDRDVGDKVLVLADGNVDFGNLLGLTVDTAAFGGLRLSRFSMIVDNGVIRKLHLEDGGAYTGISGAEQMLKDLEPT